MTATIDQLVDETWEALRPSLFRRAILGRRRCAEIVMTALAEFPDRELTARKASEGSSSCRSICREVEKRVAGRVRQTGEDHGTYGSVVLSLVLGWAVSAIVQYLVLQWWKRHFDAAAFRREYGWP